MVLQRTYGAPSCISSHPFNKLTVPSSLFAPCSAHYDAQAVHIKEEGRATTPTPAWLRRAGVSVYTYIKRVFTRREVLSIVSESTQNFKTFHDYAWKFSDHQKNRFYGVEVIYKIGRNVFRKSHYICLHTHIAHMHTYTYTHKGLHTPTQYQHITKNYYKYE